MLTNFQLRFDSDTVMNFPVSQDFIAQAYQHTQASNQFYVPTTFNLKAIVPDIMDRKGRVQKKHLGYNREGYS
jgi:hypothetical protein